MKRPAVKHKNRFAGPAIMFLGSGGGLTLVIVGRFIFDGTKETGLGLETMGWMTVYPALIFGFWGALMAINAKQIKLPVTRTKFLSITFVLIFILYILGGKVHVLTMPLVWVNILIFLVSISLVIWSLPKREKDGTWAETIIGAFAVFVMMTLLYAVIPHEWITYATSYLNFTKDVKISTGGEFILKTWLDGSFWNDNTKIIPFEVNMVHLQDQTTTLIYIIGAVINVKLFVAWQNRNQPYVKKSDAIAQGDEAPTKTSRFGRPVKKTKKVKAAKASA